MQCSKCGKEAFTRVQEMDGGENLYLCPDCYRRYIGGTEKKRCPACGTTLADYRRTGLFGCADCYLVFREEILPEVVNVQGRLRHEGKEPSMLAPDDYSFVFVQEDLRAQLERALREHRYDEVEQLGKELKALERNGARKDEE